QAAQCVLAEGECPCSGTAVTEGLGTHCYALSEVGVCSGWRSCTEGGLTACDAPVPAPEVCWNDVDEDCDGTQDDADECCFPHCEGKVCGSDGCGGSCGDCGDGELCTGEGLCVCVPHCAGLQCGPDGCGGSCGACPPQYACDPEGQCACVPDCAGKDCGSDGCGGSCGGCPINHVCTEAFACLCVPACQGKTCGTDGCGGSCGGCPPGTVCLFGECQEGCNGDGDCGLLEECVGGYCHPDVPDAALLVDAGGLVESVPGQPTAFLLADVTEAGLTTAAGQGPGLVAQAGWGPPGMDPQANPQAWTWVAAAWHADAGAADRYRAKLTEDSPGTRAWTFRFSLDGLHWTYADAEAPAEDYDPTALGTWSVLPPPVVTGVVPPRGTVLGGTTVFLQGKHFADGLTLTLDGVAVTPISVLEDLVTFVTPSHAAGPVDLLVTNPSGQAADLEDGYRFVHVYSPVLDGNLGEWNPLLRVGEGSVASDWNPALNHLDALYAAFDGIYLYVAVAGACEPFNYFLAYVDG
ncbi:MAG: IPT/TIG domain-containing protein, partial [Deltaproteobacteria bacterium]|nr:IPT/TIG domain-containing protein [Deltaproteobacteria bacterium]